MSEPNADLPNGQTPVADPAVPVADPAPPAADPKASGDGVVTPAPAAPAEPADAAKDWRQSLSGGDEKVLKALERYNTPADVAKAFVDLRTKLSSGEYRRNVDPPKDDPEALATWRKEHNVPESYDQYDTKIDGVAIGEEDKPYIDKFLQSMHERNVPQGAVKDALSAYFKMREEIVTAEVNEDRAFQQRSEEALRETWGHEYQANLNLAKEFAISRFGENVGKALLEAGADSVKALADISRELNPAMTLVPNSSNPNQAIADELEQLRKEIGTHQWFRDPKKQERYQQLIAAKERIRA